MSAGYPSEPPGGQDGDRTGQQPGWSAPQPGQPGGPSGYPPPEATQPGYGPPGYGPPGSPGTSPGPPLPYGAPGPYGQPSPYGAPGPYGQPPSYGAAASPYGGGAFGPGQPGPGYGSYPGSPPPTYLAWGIIAAIGGVLFCLIGGVPTAIAATTYARRVQRKWAMGDAEGAWRDSRTARAWAIAATVLDAIGVLILVLVALGAAKGGNTGTP